MRRCRAALLAAFVAADIAALPTVSGGAADFFDLTSLWRRVPFFQACEAGGRPLPPLLVGIAGASGCGKTTLANSIASHFGPGEAAVLTMDNYYRSLDEETHLRAMEGMVNFDRLEALDINVLADDLRRIRSDEHWPVLLPSYDFNTHQRVDGNISLARPRVVVVEGLFLLASDVLREMLDVRLFVQASTETCLIRRLQRDASDRGIALDSALKQYEEHVKPAYDEVVAPSAVHADLIVPTNKPSDLAANLVANMIWSRTTPSCAHGSLSRLVSEDIGAA